MRGKSTFNFDKNQKEFIVPIKKNFHWWYLIPLLLLLLLIKCNSFVAYRVIDADTKEAVDNAEISLKSNFYNLNSNKLTDTAGYTNFFIGKYPIYKILFSNILKQNINTSVSHRFYSSVSFDKTLKKLSLNLNIIELKKYKPVHITVIDSITRKPIENIKIIGTFANYTETKISDINGNAVFSYSNFSQNEEVIINTESQNYEDVRRYYIIHLPETINDTIALLSIKDGGLKGQRGDITVNLKWHSTDDLDLMIIDPCDNQVYYKHKKDICGSGTGFLDIDANSNPDSLTTEPQENIFWKNPSKGAYKIFVYFYKKRNNQPVPFKITMLLKNKRKVIDSTIVNQKDYFFMDSIVIQ